MDDLSRSLLMAELSMISYLDPADADEPARTMGFDGAHFIDRDGAQAYVFTTATDRVIACRGTEPHEWNDLKADANALHDVAETVGRLHRGFKREVDDLWPRIREHLAELDKDHDLWFTGHSLGGAMAMICAGRCTLEDIPEQPIQTVTFGSPRVGTHRYVTHAGLDILRWVNNNDIVPRVPPSWMGYTHTGTLMYLDSDGVHRRMTRAEIGKDRWEGFKRALRRGRVDNISDHLITDYVAHIAMNLRRRDGSDLGAGAAAADQSAK